MALRLISTLTALLLVAALLGAAEDAAAPQAAAPADSAPADSAADDTASAELNPLGLNGACYVCHIPFVKEELAKTHLAQGISCAKCHGLSDKHANDEDIGATKPDITFRREQVDASCGKCHTTHDAPATEVVARFHERKLKPKIVPVCTDCHGHHRIDRSADR